MKNFLLFSAGGMLYVLVELLYRGHSHISMFVLGGACFLLIGLLNEHYFSWQMALTSQMLLATCGVLVAEYITGLIVNIWLGLSVWDYSSQPFNLHGQICLLYTCYWFWLSLPAILLDDLFREKWFGEPRKKYKIL